MTLYYFLFLPITTALISCCALVFCVWYFFCMRRSNLHKNVGVSDDGVNNEDDLINHRLDAIIAAFKEQIPMIGMFLSKTKEDSLKKCAREELVKLIPEFKQRLVPVISKVFWKKLRVPLLGTIFLIGFLLGLLQATFLYAVSH